MPMYFSLLLGRPQQNIGQNQNIVIEHLSFEKAEKFKYLGVTVTNMNGIREEIKLRINMLSKQLKVKYI